MTVIKGKFKNKTGNVLSFHTTSDQVEHSTGVFSDTILQEVINSGISNGKLIPAYLPDIVNHYKGTFVNESQMPETGILGDYLINSTTDTVWVWDLEKTPAAGWIGTQNKGQVTSINGKTGEVILTLSSFELTVSADIINKLPTIITDLAATKTIAETAQIDATKAITDSAAALLESTKADILIVASGETVPTILRDGGLYFEINPIV